MIEEDKGKSNPMTSYSAEEAQSPVKRRGRPPRRAIKKRVFTKPYEPGQAGVDAGDTTDDAIGKAEAQRKAQRQGEKVRNPRTGRGYDEGKAKRERTHGERPANHAPDKLRVRLLKGYVPNGPYTFDKGASVEVRNRKIPADTYVTFDYFEGKKLVQGRHAERADPLPGDVARDVHIPGGTTGNPVDPPDPVDWDESWDTGSSETVEVEGDDDFGDEDEKDGDQED